MADIYTYPDSDVLRNKADIRDLEKLHRFEYVITTARAADAPTFPLTATGYQAMHKHLLGEVYDWAGQLRTISFTKQDSRFTVASSVSDELDNRFRRLEEAGQLRGLSADRFGAGAAQHIAGLNAVHPFREGNGRTMRLHLQQLAMQAGHTVDVTRIPAAQWNAASIKAHEGDASSMARVIQAAIEPRQHLTVDAAIGRVGELRESAIQQIQQRARVIGEEIRAGRASMALSKELSGLRAELAAIGSPTSSKVLEILNRLKASGGQEIASLSGRDSPAHDQLHAIHQGAVRLAGIQQPALAPSSPLRATVQDAATPAEVRDAKTPLIPLASPSPSSEKGLVVPAKPTAYWTSLSSSASKAAKPSPGEPTARTYKAPKG